MHDWTGFYSATVTFAATLVAVLGAVIGLKGHRAKERIRFLGVIASLSEIGVASFVSLSRLSPGTPLLQVVPVGACAGGVLFAVLHIAQSLRAHWMGGISLTKASSWELAANVLPFTAYLLILLNSLIPGPEWLIALGVLWLTASGMFQSVRYLAISR